MAGENLGDGGPREDVAEGVDGVARSQGEERRYEQPVTIEDQSHLKFPEQLDVLLSVFLGEVLAFEHVCKN